MIRIPISPARLAKACDAHGAAVTAYVKRQTREYRKKLYGEITKLMPAGSDFDTADKNGDWKWLTDFILADMDTLRKLVTSPAALQFDEFRKLYSGYFSAGSQKYVDSVTKYNAYTFIKNIGLTVCPYCEEEYLDVIETSEGGKKRTLEIDHFFPKGKYPALAMCFFNLVPSGQNCNGLKLEADLGMSPYEDGIDECTYLYPDLPVGINMENVPVEDCTIHFHPKARMVQNVQVLYLEERYKKYKDKAHKYLTLKQQYNDEKIEEMVRQGFFKSKELAYRFLYEEPLVDDEKQKLLAKLKRDITGRKI